MDRTNRSLPILKVHFKNPSYDFSFQRLQFSVSSMKTKRFSKQNEICFVDDYKVMCIVCEGIFKFPKPWCAHCALKLLVLRLVDLNFLTILRLKNLTELRRKKTQ